MRTLVLTLLGLALAGSGNTDAAVPDPGTSTTPSCVLLVGIDPASQRPDPVGEFCIAVRDAAGIPVAGSLVSVVFADCVDLRLCASSFDPEVAVDCAGRTLSRIADAGGNACFTVVGGAVAGPCSTDGCVRFEADGVPLGTAHAAAMDLDSSGVIGPGDGSRWLDDFFGAMCPRIDCDCSGDVGPADYSFWQDHFFGSFVQGCPELPCP